MSVLDRVRAGAAPSPAPDAMDPALEGVGSPWGPQVVVALEAFRTAQARKADAEARVLVKEQALDGDDAAAAEQVALDPERVVDLARAQVQLREELKIELMSLGAHDERIANAAREVWRAQAVELRGRLRAGDRELQDHRETAARLLAQLEEHEAVVFEPRTETVLGEGGDWHRFAPTTRSESMLSDRYRLAKLVWVLGRAVEGVVPDYSAANQPVPAYPASVRGAAALLDLPRSAIEDGTAQIEAIVEGTDLAAGAR